MRSIIRRRKEKRRKRELETRFSNAMSVNDYDAGMQIIHAGINLSKALFSAMYHHRVDFEKILLDEGADPAQGMWGSLQGYCVGHVPRSYVDDLLDTRLFDVLGMNDVLKYAGHRKKLIHILCEHGVDINTQNYKMTESALLHKKTQFEDCEATQALRYQLENGLDAEGAFIHFVIKSNAEDMSFNRKLYNKYALILFQEATDFGLDTSLWQYNARKAWDIYKQEQHKLEKEMLFNDIYEKINKQINDVPLMKAGCKELRETVRAEFSRLARGDVYDFIERHGSDLCAQAKGVDEFMDFISKTNVSPP